MNRTSQAPPVCEPWKRERRPSRSGDCLSRMIAKVEMPNRHMMAMKSWAKPRTGQVPMSGMAKPGSKRAPYAST